MLASKTRLSPKQAEILTFIETEVSRSGRPPTYRDIARHCGYEAVGTVQDHLRALIKKGFLQREPGVARGLKLAHRAESIDVPILGTVPAGRPIEAIQTTLGSVSAPAKWGMDLYALRVTGDSMIGAGIVEGDLVIVRPQVVAQSGEIVVALVHGDVTVKTLERRNGRVRLVPANPKYQPIEIDQHTTIQGKVVALHRLYP